MKKKRDPHDKPSKHAVVSSVIKAQREKKEWCNQQSSRVNATL